ncbi:TonB-dependent receptor [Porticoccus sp. GXU_MW_L64]
MAQPHLLIAASIGLAFLSEPLLAECPKKDQISFNIHSASAEDALRQLSEQANLQLIYPHAVIDQVVTTRVVGDYCPEQALQLLFAGVPVEAYINHNRVIILRLPKQRRTQTIDTVLAISEDADGNKPLEEVLIVGTRYAYRRTQDLKWQSHYIADSIVESEISTYSAANIAELLSSQSGFYLLPAIALPENFTNEQRFASIRGINPQLNNVYLDGLALANTNEAGRAQYLDWLPINMASRVEVHKNFTADLNADSIGGQINLVTRSGLDYEQPLFTLTSSISSEELGSGFQDEEQPFNLEAVYARPVSGNIGLAVSAFYNKRYFYRPQFIPRSVVFFDNDGNFTGFDDFSGNRIPVPFQHRLQLDANNTNRFGGTLKIDRRSSNSYTWGTATFSTIDEQVLHAKSDTRAFQRIEQQTEQSGIRTGRAANIFSEGGQFSNRSRLYSFAGGYQLSINETENIDFKTGYSWARQRQQDIFTLYRLSGEDASFLYDNSESLFSIVPENPQRLSDPNNYFLDKDEISSVILNEAVWDTQLSYSSNYSNSGWGFKSGIGYRQTRRNFDNNAIVRNPLNPGEFTLAQVLAANPPGDSFSGLSGLGGNPLFVDFQQRNNNLAPFLDDRNIFTFSESDNNDSDFNVDESIFAGYLVTRFQRKSLSAYAGLRIEHTSTSGFGERLNQNINQFIPSEANNTYTNALPSFIANYRFSDNSQIKLSYSHTLGRPQLRQLAPVFEQIDRQAGTISRANPDLKPRLSKNIDLSYEYYLSTSGLAFSTTVFQKNIADDIYQVQTTEPQQLNNLDSSFIVNEFRNASSSSIKGLEVSASLELNTLPHPWKNFGFSINSLWSNATLNLPDSIVTRLPNQAPQIHNFSLFYSGSQLDFVVSANHSDEILVALDGDAFFNRAQSSFRNTFLSARTTVNAKLRYQLSDDVYLFVTGSNLTSSDIYTRFGENREFLNAFHALGRRLEFGVTYSL